MNDEELAALWDQVFEHTKDEAAADEHVRRAMMGQQPEQETTAPEAFATHAWDATIGPPELLPERKNIQDTALTAQVDEDRKAYDATLDAGEAEHPTASNWGTGTGLLAPSIPGAATATARAAGRGLASVGKAGVQAVKRYGPAAAKVAGKAAINYAKAPFEPALDAIRQVTAAEAKAAPKVVSAGPNRTVSGKTTYARIPPKTQEIIDNARVTRAAKAPVNPSTGKPVSVKEVQGAIDKETRINEAVKARKQPGATKAQLDARSARAASVKAPQAASDFPHMTVEELQNWIKNESIGDAQRNAMRVALQRRTAGGQSAGPKIGGESPNVASQYPSTAAASREAYASALGAGKSEAAAFDAAYRMAKSAGTSEEAAKAIANHARKAS